MLKDILPIVLSTDADIMLIETNLNITLTSCNITTATKRDITVLSALKGKNTRKKLAITKSLQTTIIHLLIYQIHQYHYLLR